MGILTAERLEEIRFRISQMAPEQAVDGCYIDILAHIDAQAATIAALTPPAEGEVATCIGHLRNATEWHAYTSWAATGGGGLSQECKSPFTAADLLASLSAENARLKGLEQDAFFGAQAAEAARDAAVKALEEANKHLISEATDSVRRSRAMTVVRAALATINGPKP